MSVDSILELRTISHRDIKMRLAIFTFFALIGAVLAFPQENSPTAIERVASPQDKPGPPRERAAIPEQPQIPTDRLGALSKL